MILNNQLENEWKVLLGSNINDNFFSYDLSLTESKNLFKNSVKVVNIETFSYCNRKCSYCPVSLLILKERNYLNQDIFESIIKDLSLIDYSNKISLNLYNEPLSDNSIFDTIKYIRKYLPRAIIFFNSNGDYVTKDILEKLVVCGLNSINITLHVSPTSSYNDRDSEIALEKFYSKLNMDFKIDSRKDNEYIRTSFSLKNLKVSVVTSNYGEYGESRAGSISNLINNRVRNWPCARPYREFTIFSNGHAYPCCQIYAPLDNLKNSLGDLKNNNIFEIFSSKIMVDLRKHLFDYSNKKNPCSKCTEPFLHNHRERLV